MTTHARDMMDLVDKLRVRDMQHVLRCLGTRIKGNKATLRARLRAVLTDPSKSAARVRRRQLAWYLIEKTRLGVGHENEWDEYDALPWPTIEDGPWYESYYR